MCSSAIWIICGNADYHLIKQTYVIQYTNHGHVINWHISGRNIWGILSSFWNQHPCRPPYMETDSCLHMGIDSQQRTIVCINSESLGPSVLFQTTVRISSNSVKSIALNIFCQCITSFAIHYFFFKTLRLHMHFVSQGRQSFSFDG